MIIMFLLILYFVLVYTEVSQKFDIPYQLLLLFDSSLRKELKLYKKLELEYDTHLKPLKVLGNGDFIIFEWIGANREITLVNGTTYQNVYSKSIFNDTFDDSVQLGFFLKESFEMYCKIREFYNKDIDEMLAKQQIKSII